MPRIPQGNFGNLITIKNDIPACMRYSAYVDTHEHQNDISWKGLKYLRESAHDDNDMCGCRPDAGGVVWSQVMQGFGPTDQKWSPDMTPKARRRVDEFLMEEVEDGAEQYHEYQKKYADVTWH